MGASGWDAHARSLVVGVKNGPTIEELAAATAKKVTSHHANVISGSIKGFVLSANSRDQCFGGDEERRGRRQRRRTKEERL